jgi:pimeloyl-ACP methyl ester carboxylesterase
MTSCDDEAVSGRGQAVRQQSGGRNAGMAVDGFELAYDRAGSGPAVVLLHGWPGDRTDYRDLVPLLPDCDVVVPDLRGFGHSGKHVADPVEQYSSAAQARSVAELITSLGLIRPVVVGYDIGSRIAQTLAQSHPDLVRALVISPPLPGVGDRIFGPGPLREFWYQQFHRLPLSEALVDGKPDAVREYLRHFWEHWSGPDFSVTDEHLDHLVSVYGPPGAFTASVQWYRAGAGTAARAAAESTPAPGDRLATPTVVLWPEFDPLFPREWSDRIGEFFSDARLRFVDGAGHYAPLEYPAVLAEEIHRFLT